MPSANGYALEVQGHTLTAVWPAPFYALCLSDGPDGPDAPLLIHCDDYAHALGKRPALILDANFQMIARFGRWFVAWKDDPPEDAGSDPRPDPRTHPEYWME